VLPDGNLFTIDVGNPGTPSITIPPSGNGTAMAPRPNC
jgi:hypothetical protein